VTQPAPLIEIPELPIPAGGSAEWYTGADGAYLRAAIYAAAGGSRGSVIVSPGRVEPIEKYHEVVAELRSRGYTVLVHDWRGQGLSQRFLPDRMRGHAHNAEEFRGDYTRLLDHFEARLPRPWIQLGHSMGGALALYMLARGERRFHASALSSPMLGVYARGFGYALTRILAKIMTAAGFSERYVLGDPDDPFAMTFEDDKITHDHRRWDRFMALRKADPELALGNLTWGWLEFAMSMTDWLRRPANLKGINIPVLIVASGSDDRVKTADSLAVARRLPKARIVVIDRAWHEVLMETDDIRAIWWREFDALTRSISPTV
jgi:lysophospholipase